jgi:hypothetical protein
MAGLDGTARTELLLPTRISPGDIERLGGVSGRE